MNMRIEQRWEAHANTMNRFGEFTEITVNYIVFDVPEHESAPEEAVLFFAHENIPQQLNDLLLNEITIDDRAGADSFYLTARYVASDSVSSKRQKSKFPQEKPTVTFDCSGTTITVPYAKKQWPVAGSPDVGLVIGWNGKYGDQMQISGATIPMGKIRKTYTREFLLAEITPAVEVTWSEAVGKVNDRNFLGWPEGSAMFMGCSYSGDDTLDSVVKVSFVFEMAAPENAVVDGIDCGYKRGHDYIWTINDTATAPTGEIAVRSHGIWIAQVTDYINFDIFGL